MIIEFCFQNYQMNTGQWRDIAYNFLVGEDGNVYEGRGWGKIASQAEPFKYNSINICIIGNFASKIA
jgi:N-acetylmuramoyl-L-alanine amidase